MRCDFCGHLFQYHEEIVALRECNAGVEAVCVIEIEGGKLDATFDPVAKYHAHCYDTMKEAQPEKWPDLAQSQSPDTGS
jgi:hypothetical protein